MAAAGQFTIAHISDLHCGGPYFVPNLMERAISEINDLDPDLVVCSGDLTTFGFKPEYLQAARRIGEPSRDHLGGLERAGAPARDVEAGEQDTALRRRRQAIDLLPRAPPDVPDPYLARSRPEREAERIA